MSFLACLAAVAHLIVQEGTVNLMLMSLERQFAYLFLLSIPVACVAWTVTHEEVFREPREYCKDRSQKCRPLLARKFFYLFTCEYCFSHYVAFHLNESQGPKHNVEQATAAEYGSVNTRTPKGDAQGITTHSSNEEAARQEKVVSERPDAQAGVNLTGDKA